MLIEFDSKFRRSTHVETGLAVQWVRDEPPMERQSHFKVIAGGREFPFIASYDYGEAKLKAQYPNMTALEFNERQGELLEKNFKASNIRANFDRDIFVSVWQNLVSQALTGFKVSVFYTDSAVLSASGSKFWICDG